eukprot:2297190-Pyramimonas_sp.AAC.1
MGPSWGLPVSVWRLGNTPHQTREGRRAGRGRSGRPSGAQNCPDAADASRRRPGLSKGVAAVTRHELSNASAIF